MPLINSSDCGWELCVCIRVLQGGTESQGFGLGMTRLRR
jgi:hypothetical protein